MLSGRNFSCGSHTRIVYDKIAVFFPKIQKYGENKNFQELWRMQCSMPFIILVDVVELFDHNPIYIYGSRWKKLIFFHHFPLKFNWIFLQ